MRRALRLILAAMTAAFLVLFTAVPAWAMTLTFVRHAESLANAAGVIDTSVPGPGLSPLGEQQADDVAPVLFENGYDGVYVSSMLRTQQTAQPLLDLMGTDYQILPGIREIPAGIFEGSSEDEGFGRLGYALAPIAWTLGARFVPILGAEDGNAFDARVDRAVQQIYDNGDQNAVAFSHGATIMFWVMMNVKNPDLGLMLSHQLGNTEAVVIEGSPDAGWTLVNWAGVPVAAEPSLPIKLFVDIRNLAVAPQTALYNIGRAFATGDIAALANAVRDGAVNVAKTAINFVPDVVHDIVSSLDDLIPHAAVQHAPASTLTGKAEAVENTSAALADDEAEEATAPEPKPAIRVVTDNDKAQPNEPDTNVEEVTDQSTGKAADEDVVTSEEEAEAPEDTEDVAKDEVEADEVTEPADEPAATREPALKPEPEPANASDQGSDEVNGHGSATTHDTAAAEAAAAA